MNEPILIGLSGKKGSGKSTVGKFMYEWAEENGYKPEIRGFAWLLKLSFTRIFAPDATVDEAVKFCDWFKELGAVQAQPPPLDFDIFHKFGAMKITGREALQNYGTEAHREVFGDNFWVDSLLPINDNGEWDRGNGGFSDSSDFCIVTDLRFPNEALRINELGGRCYEVQRSDLEDDNDTHASEIALPMEVIYKDIENDSSIIHLQRKVYWELELIEQTVDSPTRT